jgi:hypothetical protein
MSATVIRFQEDDDGTVKFYLESPRGIADGIKLFTLKSRPDDEEFQFGQAALQIAAAGAKLRDDLLRHVGIKSELGAWLGADDKAYRPIHLELESLAADNLPWEALVDGKGLFLAFDKNCPVARVLAAERQDKLKKEVIFTPPLRVACVLGAWWEDGGAAEQQEEWACFEKALGTADAAELQVEVCVLGCDPGLKDRVNATTRAGVNVRWQPIVGNAADLLESIRAFRPNMLHVFAHGVADDQPFVAVNTVADADAGEQGSILLGAKEIRQEGDPEDNIWVISLNSCETAVLRKQARNLASQLVRFGFPAVIGMREPVKASEARLVTRHFYEASFEALNAVPIGDQRSVEWGAFLQRVRLHLAGNTINAQTSKRWLLPVLYARTDPFIIKRGKVDLPEAEMVRLKAELETLKKRRDEAMQLPLSGKMKLDMKAEFDAQITKIEVQIV